MLRDYGGGSNVKEKMKERIKYYSDWQKVLWATMVLVIGGSVGLIFKSGYGEARVTLGALGFVTTVVFGAITVYLHRRILHFIEILEEKSNG